MVLDVVLPSAPDFSWDHATTGELDADGYVLVIVTVRACCSIGCSEPSMLQASRSRRCAVHYENGPVLCLS
jgi:hypothetical protein